MWSKLFKDLVKKVTSMWLLLRLPSDLSSMVSSGVSVYFCHVKFQTAYTWNSDNWDAIFLNFKLWNAQISILVNKLWILVACSFQFPRLTEFWVSWIQFQGLENFGFWVLFQFIGLHAILVCMYCCTCTLMVNLPKICRIYRNPNVQRLEVYE